MFFFGFEGERLSTEKCTKLYQLACFSLSIVRMIISCLQFIKLKCNLQNSLEGSGVFDDDRDKK